jgi:hypothetical protein
MIETTEVNDDLSRAGLKNNIKDWGLSHPTLEEVFLRLTN